MRCEKCPARSLGFYADLGVDQIQVLDEAARGTVEFRKGALIVDDQARAADIYMLHDGWAYSFVLLGDGTRQILRFYLQGDLVSLAALTGGGVRASVRALTKVSACRFDRDAFLAAIAASAPLQKAFLGYIGEQRRIYESRAISLGALAAEEAVAVLIMVAFHAARRRGAVQGTAMEFPLRLQHIADALGMTEVHAGRCMRSLESQGAIRRIDAGKLDLDLDQLKRAAARAVGVLGLDRPAT